VELNKQEVFSVPEAARFLRVSEKSVWKAIRRGEIKTARLGHRVLVPRTALDEFLGGQAA
jgi:excisionase family DNA binding protein